MRCNITNDLSFDMDGRHVDFKQGEYEIEIRVPPPLESGLSESPKSYHFFDEAGFCEKMWEDDFRKFSALKEVQVRETSHGQNT